LRSSCLARDYLAGLSYRRYRRQALRHEITLYSVWFELRFGIVGCLMLTVALITMIFYYHPRLHQRRCTTGPSDHVRSNRPVAQVHVELSASVKQGDMISD